MGELHHECGVAAIYHLPGAGPSPLCPEQGPGGSFAAGSAHAARHAEPGAARRRHGLFHPDRSQLINTHKEVGGVAEAFRLNHRGKFEPDAQVRPGRDRPRPLRHLRGGRPQRCPALRARPRPKPKWFAFAFNGQLANYEELRKSCCDGDYHLKRDTDTEIIMHSLAYELQAEDQEPDGSGSSRSLAERFDGAYNIVLDQRPRRAGGGPRPARLPAALHRRARSALRGGQRERAAGQSRLPQHPLARARNAGRSPITDGVRIERFAPSPRQAHCFFEWIYFANVASTLDDRSVYLSRAALGKELARLEDVPLDADTIVVPVPDTAKAAADAMAFALGVPSVEGLMRNRYVGRTFIEGTADRAAKARLKYTPLPEVLAGKRVLLVEDSIVRSTTMRALVARDPRPRRGPRDPSPRRLPADHRPVLLRHRHVHDQRAVRSPVHGRRRISPVGKQRWRPVSDRFSSVTCRSSRSHARSISPPTNFAGRALPAVTRHFAGQQLYQLALNNARTSRSFGAELYETRRSPPARARAARLIAFLSPSLSTESDAQANDASSVARRSAGQNEQYFFFNRFFR